MEKIKNKVIVIGGDHHNTLCAVRGLGHANIFPYVIIVGTKKSFVAKSRYVARSWMVKEPEEILDILHKQFLQEEILPVIISSNDVCSDVLDRNYSWLSQRFLLPHIDMKEGQISYWMDKSKMIEAAEKAGFNVPKTWRIDLEESVEVVDLIPENVIFPCIVKPCRSIEGAKTDFRISNCRQELEIYLKELKQHVSVLLIQEYLKPDYEISCAAVRLLNTKKNTISGIIYKLKTCSSMSSMGMLTFAHLTPSIERWIDMQTVNRFFESVKYYGIYSFDFVIHNDKTYFMETNFRSDGNMFMYLAAGVNLHLLWVTDITGNDISLIKCKVNKRIYGMIEVSYLKYFQWKYFWRNIRDCFRADCFALFSFKDIKPFVYKFIYSSNH